MLLQPIMASLPGGLQTDKEKKKTKKKNKETKANDTKKVKGYVIMYYTIYTVVLIKVTTLCIHVLPF